MSTKQKLSFGPLEDFAWSLGRDSQSHGDREWPLGIWITTHGRPCAWATLHHNSEPLKLDATLQSFIAPDSLPFYALLNQGERTRTWFIIEEAHFPGNKKHRQPSTRRVAPTRPLYVWLFFSLEPSSKHHPSTTRPKYKDAYTFVFFTRVSRRSFEVSAGFLRCRRLHRNIWCCVCNWRVSNFSSRSSSDMESLTTAPLHVRAIASSCRWPRLQLLPCTQHPSPPWEQSLQKNGRASPHGASSSLSPDPSLFRHVQEPPVRRRIQNLSLD